MIFTGLVYLLFMLLLTPAISTSSPDNGPRMVHNKLGIQKIITGMERPTGFDFVDNKDMLIIEKDGKVKLARDFELKKYPIMDLNVYNGAPDSGLLGITIDRTNGGIPFVFLSYTASPLQENDTRNANGVRHLIYRYEWNSTGLELDNPVLVMDLPYVTTKHSTYETGKIAVGPAHSLFSAVTTLPYDTKNKDASNGYCDTELNGVILLTYFTNNLRHSGSKIYACGTSNTLSLAFDSITGSLWNAQETTYSNEGQINLITPDFRKGCDSATKKLDCDKSQYTFPSSITPTAIDFSGPNISIGANNSMFAGDLEGEIYLFNLDREQKTLNEPEILGTGFGQISDLKSGPGDALYILTSLTASDNGITNDDNGEGIIYRVSTNILSLPVLDSYISRADHLGLVGTLIAVASIITFLALSKVIKVDKLRL